MLLSVILIAISIIIGINVANQQTPDSTGAADNIPDDGGTSLCTACRINVSRECQCWVECGGLSCEQIDSQNSSGTNTSSGQQQVCQGAGWSGCGSNGCGSGQTSFRDPTSCSVSCHDDPGTCNPSPGPSPTPQPSPTPTPTPTPTPAAAGLPACGDGIDNDNDGRIDCTVGNPDPGCFPGGLGVGTCSTSDASESDGATQCNDGIDNDNDGSIDCNAGNADPGCFPDGLGGGTCNLLDGNETNAAATTPNTAGGSTDIFSILGGIAFLLVGASLALFR
jgi:hypothetical protein